MPESGNELYAYYAVSYKGKVISNKKIVPAVQGLQKVIMEDYTSQLLTAFEILFSALPGDAQNNFAATGNDILITDL